MALFGERPSVSPRLPSPWQAALAQPSPAISVISRNDVLRTPSQLSLSTGGSDLEEPLIDEVKLPGSVTSSLASSSAFQRLRSSGISEDLILSPMPGYTSSASVSVSTSTSASAILDDRIAVRQGVSGGLAGHGYEGVKLVAERDKVGHIEYKLRLLPPNAERFERLTTQLKWRLQEGGGQAVYEIGVLDDGTLIGITDPEMDRSLQTLELMAAELGATVMVLRTITLACPPPFPKALCGYEAGAEVNEEDADAALDLFGGEGREHGPRKIKKKKSPRPPKPKQKPSVFTVSDIAGGDDSENPSASNAVESYALTSYRTQEENSVSDHQQRARQKSQSKMARRRLTSGFPVGELSAKQRRAWGVDRKGQSIWDDYDSEASAENGDGRPRHDSARTGDADANTSAIPISQLPAIPVSILPSTEPPTSDPDVAPVAESWRARNMERASQQDPERWRHKPVMTPAERDEVKQGRKARRKLKKDHRRGAHADFTDQHGFGAFFGSDESGGESPALRPRLPGNGDGGWAVGRSSRDSDVDDDEVGMFAFDNLSSSEASPQRLTQAAVAALGTTSSHQVLDHRTFKKGFHQSDSHLEHEMGDFGAASHPHMPSIKQVKKRRVRVQRAEQRRLDLLRGDGITAEGMPLAFDPDNHIGATSVMEAELNDGLFDNENGDPDVLQIVRRLVGDGVHESDDSARGDMAGATALLSTSPSYTIKPSSPSAQRMFSLPTPLLQTSHMMMSDQRDVEPDDAPPSPSDTITMPLDSLSLSFSYAEVCTAVSPFGSPGRNDYELGKSSLIHDKLIDTDDAVLGAKPETVKEDTSNAVDLNLAGARVCVEALIVKKMDMDDRYLDFSGFIL